MKIKFIKVHTFKDLTFSILGIFVGAALFFLHAGLGLFIAVCGVFTLLFWKTGYKVEGDDTLLRRQLLDLSQSCRPSIMDFLSGKDVVPDIRTGNEGGVVQLEVWYSDTAKVAYARLYDFVNYTYEQATDIVELHDARADRLISRL